MTCLSLITNDINNIIYSLGLWQSFKPLIHLGSLLELFNPISDIRMSRGILGTFSGKGVVSERVCRLYVQFVALHRPSS